MKENIRKKWKDFIHSPFFIPLRLLFVTFITGSVLNVIFFLGVRFGFDLNVFSFHLNSFPLLLLLCSILFIVSFLIVKLSTWFPGKKEFCTPDVEVIKDKNNDIYEKIENLSEELESRDLELQRTEFKYRNLFTMLYTMTNNIPDIIWSKNMKGKYQFINDAGAAIIFNTIPDDVIGRTDIDLLSDLPHREEFLNRFMELDRDVINSSTQIKSVETIIHDNKEITLEIIKSPIISKVGKIEGTVGCARDISSKITNEKTIQRKENALELILYASREFLRGSNWETYLKNFITRLGSVMEVERVLLFKRNFIKKSDYIFDLDYEWALNRQYLFKEYPYISHMSLKDKFPRWLSMFRQGNIVKGNISDFFEDEKTRLAKQGIKSTLCVPILVENRLWGFIGFDNFLDERIWDPMEIKVLKTSANIISAAIEQKEFMKKIEDSEKQFRQIFERINSGLILIDKNTNIIEEANSTAKLLIGNGNGDELIGKKYKDGFCEITSSQIDQFKLLKDTINEEPFECSCIDKTGKTRNCIKSISAVNINDREFILLNFMNTTDKKTLEDSLNYQRNRYRQLIEKFNELILEVEIPSGKVNYINLDFTDRYGIDSNTTIDIIIEELVLPSFQKYVFEILENAKIGVVPDIFEFKAKNEKNNYIWVEATCNPITNELGDVIGLEIICRNITKRKQLFEELQIKKEFQENIIENVPVGLFYKDQNGKYLFVNNEFSNIVEMKKDQIIGKTVRDILGNDRSKLTEDKDREILGTIFSTQYYEMYLDKLDKYVYVNKIISKDQNGNILGIIGSIVDRTEIVKSKNEMAFKEAIYHKTLNDLIYPSFVRDKFNTVYIANNQFCKLFGKEKCNNVMLTDITKDETIIDSLLNGDELLDVMTYPSFEKEINIGQQEFRMRKSIFSFENENYILTTLRNITEQNQLIKKLEDIRAIYKKTINTLNYILFVVDKDLKLILYNDKFSDFFKDEKNEDNLTGSFIFSKFLLFSQNIRTEYKIVLDNKTPLETETEIYVENKQKTFSIIKLPIIEDNKVNYIVTLMKSKDNEGENVNEESLFDEGTT